MFTTAAGHQISFGQLGFGGAPLGNMHRVLDETEVRETLEAASTLGVRYFDTAPLYGHGLSERRIGRALRKLEAGSYVLSTKVGRLLEACAPGEEDSGIYRNTPALRVSFDYSYEGIMRSLEHSLERLGLNRVDILYVHDVDARTHGGIEQSSARIRELIDEGGWRALADLRSSGVVSAIGAGVNEWEPCQRLLSLADPDLFLLAGRYTLLEQAPLETLFPACEKRGVGIVIGGPFNSGVLAGKPTYDYSRTPVEIAALVSKLKSVCDSFAVPLAAAALQFPLAHPVVATVIPGAQSIAEVRENAALVERAIPDELWTALKNENLIARDAPVPGKI
jgi:D-threo-aldose 1-dehydrogenase